MFYSCFPGINLTISASLWRVWRANIRMSRPLHLWNIYKDDWRSWNGHAAKQASQKSWMAFTKVFTKTLRITKLGFWPPSRWRVHRMTSSAKASVSGSSWIIFGIENVASGNGKLLHSYWKKMAQSKFSEFSHLKNMVDLSITNVNVYQAGYFFSVGLCWFLRGTNCCRGPPCQTGAMRSWRPSSKPLLGGKMENSREKMELYERILYISSINRDFNVNIIYSWRLDVCLFSNFKRFLSQMNHDPVCNRLSAGVNMARRGCWTLGETSSNRMVFSAGCWPTLTNTMGSKAEW